MKFYSELTQKLYETEDQLVEAEEKEQEKVTAAQKLKEERAAAAKEVEEAYTAANEAYKVACNKLNDFCKKYGSYHTSVKGTSNKDLLDLFFNSWMF